jgi:PAS domain S-box-containing protein
MTLKIRDSALVRHGVAVLSVGIATIALMQLEPVPAAHAVYFTYLPAVLVSAAFGGWGPGVLCLVLAGASAILFFIPPRFTYLVGDPAQVIGIIGFLVLAGAIIWLGEAQRAARRRAQAAVASLENEIAERQSAEMVRHRLLAELETERNRTEARLAAFSRLGKSLSSATSPVAAARIIGDTAERLFGWDAFSLILCPPDGDKAQLVLQVDTFDGEKRELPSTDRKPHIAPRMSRVLRNGAEMVLKEDPLTLLADCAPFGDLGRPSASLMFVPVRDKNRSVGVLSIQSYTKHAYDKKDLEMLQSLADYCGDALERIQAEQALRWREAEYHSVFALAGSGKAQIDPATGHYLAVNRRFCEITGYSTQELLQKTFADITHPEDQRSFGENLQMLLRGVISEYRCEKRYLRKDGSVRWADVTGTLVRDVEGRPARCMSSVIDTTDRKLAEQEVQRLNLDLELRVQERTAQLSAANRELEAFCYSVSHDLRAPLRGIAGFAQALQDEYLEALPEDGRDCLRRVIEASREMDQLIDDLLHLSRLTRAEMNFQPVDLSGLARRIAADLQRMMPGRTVEFVIAPDLAAQGDPRLIRIALENLLNNAWKFTGRRNSARIEFGYEHGRTAGAYFVRDNGAGFDMAYAGKLFGAFQRLHGAHEFPGTGIGLATVQRIINRHGGRVWAFAEVERGATFYFTLPARPVGPDPTAPCVSENVTRERGNQVPGVKTAPDAMLARSGA